MDELGFGPLDSVMQIPGVTDVAVTPQGRVWVDAGEGMREVHPSIPFSTPARVKEYAIQLCAQLGRRLDDACPIADAASADGLRVHAVLEPLVVEGASLSIRLPPLGSPRLSDLERKGFLSPAWTSVVRELVRERASIIISGGTGTGKTTLLRALLNECDEAERVVAVEEIREIGGSLRGNFVSLASREKNVENAGEVTLSQLVSATLRMRPDRILLGECRGAEVADILRAFNTGHRGGMTTIHANGVDSLPRRLVALGQLSGLSAQGLSALTVGAFDVVLHLERPAQGGGLGRRRLAQIGSIGEDFYGGGTEEGLMSVPRGHVLSSWDGTRAPTVFPGWEGFAERWNL